MAKQYPEDTEQSAEYVRLAIPFMSQHGIPTTPPHYRVWYDYVSGRNPKLKETVDRALNVRDAIDADFSDELYDQFIEQEGDRVAEKMREEVHKLLQDTLSGITESSAQSTHFESVLHEYTQRLSVNPGRESLKRTVSELLAETKSMQDTNRKLEQRLQSTNDELETLRKELDITRNEAGRDTLTDLASREHFNTRLEQEMLSAKANGRDLSVVLIEVDDFLALSEKHGRLLGDKILRFVASHLHEHIKGTDLAARYDSRHFALVLPHTPLSGGFTLAEQIRADMESHRLRRTDTEESVGRITLSLSVAGYRNGEAMESLLKRAGDTLERACREGRNRAYCET